MTATTATPRMFAMARIGDLRVAIDSAFVVRAAEPPPRLTAIPRRAGAIEGVFACGSQAVPVVRLGLWVATGETPGGAPTGDERILVLRDEERVIGLRVDAVMGVRRLRAADLQRVHQDEDGDELFQSVATATAGDEAPWNVLEPRRLMALAGAWSRDAGLDARAQAPAPVAVAISRRSDALACFRVGDTHVALRAADIHELMPTPALEAGLPRQSAALGLMRWRGLVVPALDLAPALGAIRDAAVPPWVCIVRHGEFTVGLLVHEVLDMLFDNPVALSGHAAGNVDELVAGVIVAGADRTVQVLDSAGLMRHFDESRISARRGAAGGPAGGRRRETSAYLVFEAGTPFASPLDRVHEIIDMNDDVLARLEAGLAATLEWRGRALPVVDLRTRLAVSTPALPRQLVIVAAGERHVAVAIAGVKTIIAAHTSTRHGMSPGPAGRVEMVSVDTADHRATYALLDLGELAQEAGAVAAV